MKVKPKIRGGARCCMCFDPFSIHNVNIYVFFCCHAYHETCLIDSINSLSVSKKKPAPTPTQDELSFYKYENDDDAGEEEHDDAQMRCILCTTAAG